MLPPHIRRQVIDLVTHDGLSARAAADRVGVSYGAARAWLKAAGVALYGGTHGGSAEIMEAKRRRALEMVAAGATQRAAAREVGLSRYVVLGWCKDAGMSTHELRRRDARRRLADTIADLQQAIDDADRPTVGRGRRLIGAQRQIIALADAAGHTQAAIAALARTSTATVSRELARVTGGRGAYLADAGDAHARRSARRPKLRKLDANPRLRAEVVARLNRGWSPQLISLDLARVFGDDKAMTISGETIYQALYVQGKGALRRELTIEKALHTGRAGRRARSALPPRRGRKTWVDGAHISLRPAQAADRAVPGHWEGDLVVGAGQQSAVITLVERSSRYLLMRRLPGDHTSPTVVEAISEMIGALPRHLRASLAWDQGAEMANHADFTVATGCRVFFCDPHSPWQRGTNESTNGLIRRFFPKGTDFRTVTDEQVAEVEMLLNTRPRQTLNLMTPAEKLDEIIGVASTT